MGCLGRVQYHESGRARAQILIDAGGVRGRRIDPEYRWVTVTLDDAREPDRRPTFADDGLCFVKAPPCVREPDQLAARRPEYERALVSMLERTLGAQEVVVFDHTLRGPGEGQRPPSHHVHCDYNAYSADKRMVELLGEARAEVWRRGRFAVINVWRPLVRPVECSPLGFVLPGSVAADDWVEVDIVFPDRRGQIRGLSHGPTHRWVHLPQMKPEEAAVFTVYANEGVGGVAHAAVQLADEPAGARPRLSVESRAFVRWA